MDYAPFHTLAASLIANFGNAKKATIYRTTATYNPITQAETSTETSYQVNVVTPRVTSGRDAALVSENDILATIPAQGLAIVPKPGDQISLPERTGRFVIKSPVQTAAPDGVPIVYKIICARP